MRNQISNLNIKFGWHLCLLERFVAEPFNHNDLQLPHAFPIDNLDAKKSVVAQLPHQMLKHFMASDTHD
jgi:hypothetical protein